MKAKLIYLPSEILLEIFLFCDINCVYSSIQLVNQRFQEIVISKVCIKKLVEYLTSNFDYTGFEDREFNNIGEFSQQYKQLLEKIDSRVYIEDHLQKLKISENPSQEMEFSPMVKYCFGGKDPLDSVSFFKRLDEKTGKAYFLYVSRGFTQQNERNKKEMAFNFEFTLRLYHDNAREDSGVKYAPKWPVGMMQNLARYVFLSGNFFDVGHHVPCNGKIALNEETDLTTICFKMDEELGEIRVYSLFPQNIKFLEMCAITDEEYLYVQKWKVKGILDLIYGKARLAIIDLSRKTAIGEKEKEIISKILEEEGSNCRVLTFGRENCQVEFSQTDKILKISIWQEHFSSFAEILKGRVLFGKDFLFIFEKEEKEQGILRFVEDEENEGIERNEAENFLDVEVKLKKESIKNIDSAVDKKFERKIGEFLWIVNVVKGDHFSSLLQQ